MSDPLPSSISSTSSRFAAWLASNPPRGHSRRRSESEALVVLQDSRRSARTSSPPPAKRRCITQSKSAPGSPIPSPASSNIPFLPTLPRSATPPTILETPKPAKPRRKPQSYVKQRAQRIIQIINATFAVCEGKPARSPAYPVHQLDADRWFIPATFSEFQALRDYQDRSNASQVLTTFTRTASLSDQTELTSCVSVKMPDAAHEALKSCIGIDIFQGLQDAEWRLNGRLIKFSDTGSASCYLTLGPNASQSERNAQPDGSVRFAGESFPFLVAEIANTQTEFSLDTKIHNWTHGSREHLKFIVSFRIEPNPFPGYRVLISVDRLERQNRPTPQNPNNFVTMAHHVIDREEIFPSTSHKTFDIACADVLPKRLRNSPNIPADVASIGLSNFRKYARRAVDYILDKEIEGTPSPRDWNQESVPSPVAPGREEDWQSEGSNNDRPDDKTYKGKGIDRGGSRGSEAR
ncbi:MAG: hypothetical protein Q9180_004100 [Flavoplaca navasiana]